MANYLEDYYDVVDDTFIKLREGPFQTIGDPVPQETGQPIEPTGWVSNADDDVDGDASVVIDSEGLHIYDGKIFLLDEAGNSVLSPAGFAGSWLDFLLSNIYNNHFRFGDDFSIIGPSSTDNASIPPWTFTLTGTDTEVIASRTGGSQTSPVHLLVPANKTGTLAISQEDTEIPTVGGNVLILQSETRLLGGTNGPATLQAVVTYFWPNSSTPISSDTVEVNSVVDDTEQLLDTPTRQVAHSFVPDGAGYATVRWELIAGDAIEAEETGGYIYSLWVSQSPIPLTYGINSGNATFKFAPESGRVTLQFLDVGENALIDYDSSDHTLLIESSEPSGGQIGLIADTLLSMSADDITMFSLNGLTLELGTPLILEDGGSVTADIFNIGDYAKFDDAWGNAYDPTKVPYRAYQYFYGNSIAPTNLGDFAISVEAGGGTLGTVTTVLNPVSPLALQTAAATTGGARITGNGTFMSTPIALRDGYTYIFRGIVRTGTDLSNATNRYQIWFGLSNTPLVADSSDPLTQNTAHFLGIRYRDDHLAGNWAARNNDATTQVITDTGIAVAANTQYIFEIVATDTEIKYYIDGALVATHTTKIPTANMGFTAGIRKTAGTAGRQVVIPLVELMAIKDAHYSTAYPGLP